MFTTNLHVHNSKNPHHTVALQYITLKHLITNITIFPSYSYYTNISITLSSETLFEYNDEDKNKRIRVFRESFATLGGAD